MNFNRSKFQENRKLLMLIGVIVAFTLLLSLIVKLTNTYFLKEKPLIEQGEIKTSKLIISEVMADNNGMFSDEHGQLYDWVELYNGSEKEIHLAGYGLSDVLHKSKWKFPDVTIEPKQYLIVQLASANRNGLYANFALKKNGGETLVLVNTKGAVIDALDVFAVGRYQSMARDVNGVWHATSQISPGFENSQEGHEAFLESLYESQDELIISEVLPRNRGNFIDEYNQFNGFIEITNVSERTIDVGGYFLSNKDVAPFRFRLPSRQLKPKEALVVYTSSQNLTNKTIHANFTLDSQNGTVMLANNKGKVIDQLSYEYVPNGFALIRVGDEVSQTPNVSPGYLNNTEGIDAFNREQLKNHETLLINEMMNRNYVYLPHNGDQYYDWVELLNNSKKPINLSEYTLSTSLKNIDQYRLPDVELQPQETFLLMASGDPNLSTSQYVHANFKISDVDSLYLFKDQTPVDAMFIAEVPVNYSYGRTLDGGFGYFQTPTPRASNSTPSYRSVASTPDVTGDVEGVYNDIESVSVFATSTSPVYYTTDGSVPTTNSARLYGPLTFNETTTVRFRALEAGKLASETITKSYILNENHTMPVMSLALNPGDLSYLQGNPWTVGIEVPVHASFFEDDNQFSINAGLKLFGGSARGFSKKSFSLKFKGKYKETKLNYPVFDTRDFASFDTIVLRSGSQDLVNALFRDVLGTSLADGMMEVEIQAYKPSILYINGRYWGVYNIREKVDEDFISSHFNVDDRANVIRIDSGVSSGSARGYNQMVQYAVNHDLRVPQYWEHMKSILNLESYIDFWVASTVVANNDIINARFFNHPDIDDGRWHMIWYDLDFAMYNYDRDYFRFMVQVEGMAAARVSTALFRNLIVNQEFQRMFVERLALHVNTTFHPDRIYQRLDELTELYRPEMPRNQARWNLTMERWEKSLDDLRRYFDLRYGYMLPQAQRFFNLTNQEMELYFGGL